MNGPRIIIDGQRQDVKRLADKLIRPDDGLRPWRPVLTAIYPGGMRMEFAPIAQTDGGRPARYLLNLHDYCEACESARQCPGREKERNGRACADIEVSRLRRQIEAEAQPLHFTYHPPAYGEEDIDYNRLARL